MKLQRLIRALLAFLISVTGLLVLFLIVINLPFSRAFIKNKVNSIFSKAGLPLEINSIKKIMPGSVSAGGILVLGKEGDTIVYGGSLRSDFKTFALIRKKVILTQVALDKLDVNLVRNSEDEQLNIAAAFAGNEQPVAAGEEKAPSSWDVSVAMAEVTNLNFRMTDSVSGTCIRDETRKIRIETKKMSLVKRIIKPASIAIEGLTGSIELIHGSGIQESDSSQSWVFSPGDMDISDLNFLFDDQVNKIKLDLLSDKIKIKASGTDLQRKLIDFDLISLSRTNAMIHFDSGSGSNMEERKTTPGNSPWTVKGNELKLRDVAFSLAGYSGNEAGGPFSGFSIAGLNVTLDDLLADSSALNADLKRMDFSLGNGFSLKKMTCRIASDEHSTGIDLTVSTRLSSLEVSGKADAGLSGIVKDPSAMHKASLEIDNSVIDLNDLFFFKPYLRDSTPLGRIPSKLVRIHASGKLSGQELALTDLSIAQKPDASASMQGNIRNVFSPGEALAELKFGTGTISHSWIKGLFAALAPSVQVPSFDKFSVEGSVSDSLMSPKFGIKLNSDLGNIVVEGSLDLKSDKFSARSRFDNILIGRILSNNLLGAFSGSGEITGKGTVSLAMGAEANLHLDSAGFKSYTYRDAEIGMKADSGKIDLSLRLTDPSATVDINAHLNMAEGGIKARTSGRFNAALHDLHLSEDTITVNGILAAGLEKHGDSVSAEAGLSELALITPEKEEKISDIRLSLKSDSTGSELSSSSDFLSADIHSGESIDSLGSFLSDYSAYLGTILTPGRSDIKAKAPPVPGISGRISLRYNRVMRIMIPDTSFYFGRLSVAVNSAPGGNGVSYMVNGRDLRYRQVEVRGLEASMSDSAAMLRLRMNADTCRIFSQTVSRIRLTGKFHDWNINSGLSVLDSSGSMIYGLDLAVNADSNELNFGIPSHQLILNGVVWQVDPPFFLKIDRGSKNFRPSLRMRSDSSQISLLGDNHVEPVRYALDMKNVRLSDILRTEVLPGKPDLRISGAIKYIKDSLRFNRIDADLHLHEVRWSDLKYSNITLSSNFLTDTAGMYSVDLSALLDTAEINFRGRRNTDNSKDINARFKSIPVNTVQPFVTNYLSDLRGKLSGSFDLSNRRGEYTMEGKVLITGGNLRVNTLNSSYGLRKDSITFVGKKMLFNKFTIIDSLGNELNVQGSIDFNHKENVTANVEITSSHLQVMNRKKDKNSDFYGEVYINSSLSVKGPVKSPVLKGKIRLVKGTDIYFRESENLNLSKYSDIVTFTSRKSEGKKTAGTSGTAPVLYNKTSISSVVDIDPSTRINIEIARKMFNIDLAVKGGGALDYNMLVNSQVNMTGKYEISEGSASLKMIGWPVKSFSLKKGSFIRWDGRLDDPDLQIEAINRVKSSYVNPVDNKERNVDFDVTLKISNRLSDLDVLFTLDTPDQYMMSIINTMSPEEKMRQAITILLFEYIDIPGVSTSSNYVSEQVNQMVSSQLNRLTQTSIKGIDISLGLDTHTQGTSTGGEQTKTSLSYEVRKNLLNDRIKIEISGVVSDVNQSHNTNTSLNNFSFEYRIDSAGTKFLKVYNEHTYEDVFEGEVVKTGIGFTYRKNYPTLRDIWRKKEKISNKKKN